MESLLSFAVRGEEEEEEVLVLVEEGVRGFRPGLECGRRGKSLGSLELETSEGWFTFST